jgi:hypothetical protein
MGDIYVDEWGQFCRDLADGRVLVIQQMTYGKARVYIQKSKTQLDLSGGW